VNPAHLFLGTVADNNADMDAKGRANRVGFAVVNRGEAHPAAKLTQVEVDAIRASGESHAALSRRYGVANTTIFNIRNGHAWRPVEEDKAA
jgi:hypothetical protein